MPEGYVLLNPAEMDSPETGSQRQQRAQMCALAVMAKAPRPGKVKTRLAPPLTLEQSAALNICFLRDTAANIADAARSGRAAGVVCYTPVGDEAAFYGLLPQEFVLMPQRGDGFGERLLCAAQDLLRCGFGSVCLIDSDSPTLPHAALMAAVRELERPGDRVVLGPSDDGGYYLIGLKQAHAEVFERITWSTGSVYAETLERAREASLEVVELPCWYDVDDRATLATLAAELLHGRGPAFSSAAGYAAPATREFLVTMAAGGHTPWATEAETHAQASAEVPAP